MANTPAYILYHGRDTGKDKDSKKIWTRIGAVWPNKSGTLLLVVYLSPADKYPRLTRRPL